MGTRELLCHNKLTDAGSLLLRLALRDLSSADQAGYNQGYPTNCKLNANGKGSMTKVHKVCFPLVCDYYVGMLRMHCSQICNATE